MLIGLEIAKAAQLALLQHLGGGRPARFGRCTIGETYAWWIDGFTDLILRAARGENMFVHGRLPETVPPAVAPILEKALANEAAFEAKLENWLVERTKR